MNRISKLLTARDILLDVPATSKKRLFEHAALLFENEHRLERQKVFDSLFARERLGSTGLGKAVAIPHGRIRNLKTPLVAVLRGENGIPFDAPDGEPVRLLVVLLVPEHATEEHLEILSELAELLSDDTLRETLLTATDPAQVYRTLATWEPVRPAARPRPPAAPLPSGDTAHGHDGPEPGHLATGTLQPAMAGRPVRR